MVLTIAIVLLVVWLLGVTVFKITKVIIHLVLLIALVAAAMYFLGAKPS